LVYVIVANGGAGGRDQQQGKLSRWRRKPFGFGCPRGTLWSSTGRATGLQQVVGKSSERQLLFTGTIANTQYIDRNSRLVNYLF